MIHSKYNELQVIFSCELMNSVCYVRYDDDDYDDDNDGENNDDDD